MLEKDNSSYYSFSHQDGECSRMAKARKNSNEEVLHKQLVLPSSPEKGNMCKTSPNKYVHATGERMKTFPIGKWSMYTCASCGISNHGVEKCQRRQSMQDKPYKKNSKGKDHFLKKKKRGNDKKGSWFQDGNKTLCSYCGKSRH
jgi:hypothetical protein